MTDPDPIIHVIDSLIADQERRLERDYGWLFEAGEKLRRERIEEGDLASPTVAGVPSGLSPCGSQAKPLIDYRKENDNGRG